MWKILIVSGNTVQKLTAETKREALALIQWTKLSNIQRLEGHTYLIRYKV